MKKKILKTDFFDRSAVVVAKELVGKYLIRKIGTKVEKYKIVETEAYEGFRDKASHASYGKTLRNNPMFEKPGTIYVYFTYGMHWMLNIVCGKKGHPAAVLIRGIDDCSGPARLTKKLEINKNLNAKMLGKKTGLWIEKSIPSDISLKLKNKNKQIEDISSKLKIIKTPRIGVDSAGPVWSKKLYRFVLESEKEKLLKKENRISK